MKKTLLTLALASSFLLAQEKQYEISPMIGYNIAEGNIDLKDYATIGAEIQYNGFDFLLKPELSIFYAKADYNTPSLPSNPDAEIWRIALNGVHEYEKVAGFTPLAKAGIGYETMGSDNYKAYTGNTDSVFIDAGVGAKIPFNDTISFKLEALYMLKYNDDRYDNNLAILAGLNFAFGSTNKESSAVLSQEPKKEEIKEETTEVVAKVLDDDNDGVANTLDKCPNTPKGDEVDSEGCSVMLDDDNDGITNSLDLCPNTVGGEAVNSDGCPVKITLDVNFEYNSDKVDQQSLKKVKEYANFLNKYKNYSTKIVGHTDSRGSDQYNLNLSQKRADSVKKLLLEYGVDDNRVSAEGKGELEPIADNETSQGRTKNRRIEAQLIRE